MYCISSASERKHEIVCTSWSSCVKTLWSGVKHWRTALHRFDVYRKPISKKVYIWSAFYDLLCMKLWCLDNWSRILSGKPFNTFYMARLKTLQFRLTLTPLFTATHAFLISLSPFFFYDLLIIEVVSDYDWDIFFILVTLDLCLLLIHRDLWNSQKWQILISVNCDLDFF